MTKERAHLNLSDDLDISEFLPVKKERNKDTEIKTIEKVAEQSGFVSRKNKIQRRIDQNIMKCYNTIYIMYTICWMYMLST